MQAQEERFEGIHMSFMIQWESMDTASSEQASAIKLTANCQARGAACLAQDELLIHSHKVQIGCLGL